MQAKGLSSTMNIEFISWFHEIAELSQFEINDKCNFENRARFIEFIDDYIVGDKPDIHRILPEAFGEVVLGLRDNERKWNRV